MSAVPKGWDGLFEDAALVSSADQDAVATLTEHREHLSSWHGSLLGPLVVPDFRLAEVGRAGSDAADLDVCVVNTSGAGGLVSLAGRTTGGLRVVAVESALRDLDDLAGNAARVVAAAAELDSAVEVYVQVPPGPRWEAAVATVEAAGLCGALRMDGGGDPTLIARQLSVLVEADLPFKVIDPGRSVLPLMAAVQALVEGDGHDEATALLIGEPADLVQRLASWDDADVARVRRRLRRIQVSSVVAAAAELAAAGVVRPA